jgi:hypothetical protein
MEVRFHTLLASALEENDWSASRLGVFTPREETDGPLLLGDWLGQVGTGLDRLGLVGTGWDWLGQVGTGWDRLGQVGTV